jgi:hypothetical protein
MKNILLLCMVLFTFCCKPTNQSSDNKTDAAINTEVATTNLDSLLLDLKNSGKLLDLEITPIPASLLYAVENRFYPTKINDFENNQKFVKSFIDTLGINDTLYISYTETGCFHSFQNIYGIVKNKTDYTVLQQGDYPDISFLRGDSVLISFYDSTNRKVSNHILSAKDTNNVGKLSKKFLKQVLKNYIVGDINIYNKIKELEDSTTTNRSNIIRSTTNCTMIFVWKNIRQERYYKDGVCRAIF